MTGAPLGVGPGVRADEAGFTLVEVMVSLLIFGMLAAAGVAILSLSVRAQQTTGAKFDDVSALNRTLALMSGDLGQATMRAARDEGGTVQPAFTGTSDGQMRFVRAGWSNIDAAPRASLQKVAYRVEGGVLQRIAYPMVDGAAPLPATALLTNVDRVSARYRFKGAWSDRWDGSQGAPLPEAVELSIARKGGQGYRAMMLIGTGYAPPPVPGAANAAP
ncbi:type II secretion system minor pseudopilin GspJ [Sphingomonas oligophenolica]|uniref:Type II secretion system protein J n=1 Tax=Sphingomonas oligophenolica TaxID=301154 RepID=A0A502CIC4_9SPHN|nr:type II secretion system minor pseudopilin GspJ [Sphingomonas oligophenolica]TPG12390.1 type II secretion system protein GspJ [Sphingomonas oligophenolica]